MLYQIIHRQRGKDAQLKAGAQLRPGHTGTGGVLFMIVGEGSGDPFAETLPAGSGQQHAALALPHSDSTSRCDQRLDYRARFFHRQMAPRHQGGKLQRLAGLQQCQDYLGVGTAVPYPEVLDNVRAETPQPPGAGIDNAAPAQGLDGGADDKAVAVNDRQRPLQGKLRPGGSRRDGAHRPPAGGLSPSPPPPGNES